MLQAIKNLLKKFVPPPTNVFIREINRILKKSEKQYQGIGALIKEMDEKNLHQISALSGLIKQADEKNAQQIRNLEKQLEALCKENNAYKLRLSNIEDKIQKMQVNVRSCERHASEAVWAEIFNNVISDSPG